MKMPPRKPPRWLEIAHRPYGWDERDYKLAADLRQLPSYGLLGTGDWMISIAEAIRLIEAHAAERGAAKLEACNDPGGTEPQS